MNPPASMTQANLLKYFRSRGLVATERLAQANWTDGSAERGRPTWDVRIRVAMGHGAMLYIQGSHLSRCDPCDTAGEYSTLEVVLCGTAGCILVDHPPFNGDFMAVHQTAHDIAAIIDRLLFGDLAVKVKTQAGHARWSVDGHQGN